MAEEVESLLKNSAALNFHNNSIVLMEYWKLLSLQEQEQIKQKVDFFQSNPIKINYLTDESTEEQGFITNLFSQTQRKFGELKLSSNFKLIHKLQKKTWFLFKLKISQTELLEMQRDLLLILPTVQICEQRNKELKKKILDDLILLICLSQKKISGQDNQIIFEKKTRLLQVCLQNFLLVEQMAEMEKTIYFFISQIKQTLHVALPALELT